MSSPASATCRAKTTPAAGPTIRANPGWHWVRTETGSCMTLSARWLTSTLVLPTLLLLAAGGPGQPQRPAPTTIGPGRIVCNAAFCELGIGDHPRQRYRVIASNLPEAEIRRL